MKNNKNVDYQKVIKILDQRRLDNIKEQQKRIRAIYEIIPEIKKIDDQLNESGIKFIKYMLANTINTIEPVDDISRKFKKNNEKFAKEKETLLKQHGYPSNHLDLQFVCSECQDEGFKNNKPCQCFEYELSKLKKTNTIESQINKDEIFENFNFDFYVYRLYEENKEIQKGDGTENIQERKEPIVRYPRANIEAIVKDMRKFANDFPECENVILIGKAGLGKTFLCNCIANELIKKGYTVLYLSAINLFKHFTDTRFKDKISESQEKLERQIFESELLIIDDLGSECITKFVVTDFFNIINSRNLAHKSTIISTNLELKELKETYSDRIFSRLYGSSQIHCFYGEDIRIQKKYGR
ncbi:MAG: hypothetical protein ATN31_03800 [Candidatus Epulonipiscioides saccharophilum]|nr:MAG: hypothetical protein ATN31_03800 [Epulopiscium sp. AS2M-Bin001]